MEHSFRRVLFFGVPMLSEGSDRGGRRCLIAGESTCTARTCRLRGISRNHASPTTWESERSLRSRPCSNRISMATMHRIFKSTFFNFEFLRILSMTPFGGADIAECLAAAGRIKDLDADSWNRAWDKLALKAEALADEATVHGTVVSARRAYMRAANYFRAAGYMYDWRPSSPQREQVLQYSERAAANFAKAAAMLPGKTMPLKIPLHEKVSMPGWLFMPTDQHRIPGKIPILISLNGADSTQEEIYFINSIAPESGYALLTFDGPGQGAVLKRNQIPMRGDWETVIHKVLDHLFSLAQERPDLDLDLDRIAVSGMTMGAHLALRSAIDTRVKAVVAIDPFFDMWDFATKHTSQMLLGAWQSGWISTAFVNSLLNFGAYLQMQLRWELAIAQGMFGVSTPAEALLAMKTMSLKNNILDQVHCPVLVSSAAQSLYFEPSVDAKLVMDGLKHLPTTKKRLWVAADPEDGGLQAKVGAFQLAGQKTIQFLDEHLGVERELLKSES